MRTIIYNNVNAQHPDAISDDKSFVEALNHILRSNDLSGQVLYSNSFTELEAHLSAVSGAAFIFSNFPPDSTYGKEEIAKFKAEFGGVLATRADSYEKSKKEIKRLCARFTNARFVIITGAPSGIVANDEIEELSDQKQIIVKRKIELLQSQEGFQEARIKYVAEMLTRYCNDETSGRQSTLHYAPITRPNADPKSDEQLLRDFTKALVEARIVEDTQYEGFTGNVLADIPARAKALRWLAAERSNIAAIIAKSPKTMSSELRLMTALQDRYSTSIASVLARVVDRLDLVSLSKQVLDDALPLDERAMLLMILGRHEEAVRLFRELLNTKRGRSKLVVKNNIAYNEAAMHESGLPEALKTANEVLSEVSDDPELEAMVRDTIALIQMKLGNLDEARKNIKRVVRIHEKARIDHPVVHLHCYQIYSRSGDFRLGDTHLRKACKLVGGPQRLTRSAFPSDIIVSEDEIVEIIDEWIGRLESFPHLYDVVGAQLRPCFKATPPKHEKEIANQIEVILRSAGFAINREQGRISYSLKEYVPDFVLTTTSTVLEVKFCRHRYAPKRLIAEMNDDKAAYLTVYPRILFVVYDLGYITDIRRFVSGIEEVGVHVLVIKQ